MAYVTLAELKAYLKIPTATSTDDTLLTGFAARAQALIDHWTDTTWESSAASVKRFDAIEPHVCERELWFDGLWAAEIVSVTNGDSEVIPASAYVTMPRNSSAGLFGIQLKAGANYSWTFDGESPEEAIQINAYWGRTRAAPEFVKAAAVRLAAYLYRQKDGGPDADRTAITGDGVRLLPSRIPADVLDLLRPVMPRVT